jgi:hypothetical protein
VKVEPRGHAVFTPFVNHAMAAAISVPCGSGRDGLPVGMQVIAAAGATVSCSRRRPRSSARSVRSHTTEGDDHSHPGPQSEHERRHHDRLMSAARPAAAPGTELVALTAPRGFPYIATRAEAQIGGAIAIEMLAEHQAGFDAAIIAAFGDPGLLGARELFDLPVVGMAEAAMLTACMLGKRFAIVTFAQDLGPWYQECVESHGLTGRLAGIRMLDGSFASVSDVQDEKEALLVSSPTPRSNRTRPMSSSWPARRSRAWRTGSSTASRCRWSTRWPQPSSRPRRWSACTCAKRPRETFRRPAAKVTLGLSQQLADRFASR